MPASQQIDWTGLKVAAIALGNVQDAARRAAINLPPVERQRFIERVNKRSQREGWMRQVKAITSTTTLTHNEKPLSNQVQNGQNAYVNALHGQKQRSRALLAKYVVNASKVAARSRKPLEDAPLVDKVANVHAKVWPEEKQQSGFVLNLGILNQAVK